MRRSRNARRCPARRTLTLAQQFSALAQGSGANRDFWFTGVNATTSGGNLTALVDSWDASHTLTVSTGTIAAPAANVGFNNAPTTAFTGSQKVTSNRAASAFGFMHDGTGCTFVLVAAKRATALSCRVFATSDVGLGMDFIQDNPGADGLLWRVRNAAAASVISSNAAGAFTTTPTYLVGSYIEGASPEFALRSKSSVAVSGDSANAPSVGAPSSPLVIGSTTAATDFAQMDLAAFGCFHRVLTAPELVTVQQYIQATYGIAP